MISSITISELMNLANVNIIDIRSIEKYNDNHIENAQHIPFNKLLLNPSMYLNKNTKYYIYCQKGKQSMQLCKILNGKGYQTVNILGGYEAWILNK